MGSRPEGGDGLHQKSLTGNVLGGKALHGAGFAGFRWRRSPLPHTSSVGSYLGPSGVHFGVIADPSVPCSPSVKPTLTSPCNPPLLTCTLLSPADFPARWTHHWKRFNEEFKAIL